jgi:Peptidase C13 family
MLHGTAHDGAKLIGQAIGHGLPFPPRASSAIRSKKGAEMRLWIAPLLGLWLFAAFPGHAERQPSQEDFADRGFMTDQARSPGWHFTQHKKLAAAIAGLKPQRPGVVDAYVIAVGLDGDAVFGREAAEASKVLARRFDGEGRTILLAAGGGAADPNVPHGSPQSLATALGAVASVMDVKEDVLILYSTSHGDAKLGLAYQDGSNGYGMISPKRLAEQLNGLGITRRLVMISACYAGVFIPKLDNEQSVIITAASSSTTSFGCAATNDWTFFGDALINHALREPKPLAEAVGSAFGLVTQWEMFKGLPASSPQFKIGAKVSDWLTPLEARMPATTSAQKGRPAIGG